MLFKIYYGNQIKYINTFIDFEFTLKDDLACFVITKYFENIFRIYCTLLKNIIYTIFVVYKFISIN